MADVLSEIRKAALLNALNFGGKANAKAVAGKILGAIPEARKDIAGTMKLVEKIVSEINAMPPELQKKEAEKLDVKPEQKRAATEEKKLPELPKATKGKVVMRLAPNPNGPLHIGHARMIVLNDEYAKMYGGTLILRFDDSDPKNPNKLPMKEAYAWAEEDLKWLGAKYSRIERVSARLPVYYKYFWEILQKGNGYICTCDAEKWKKLVKAKRKGCPCRDLQPKVVKPGMSASERQDLTVEENMSRWKKMLEGKYKEGKAVARIKTSLEEKNPAVIDWVALRIVDAPKHPLVDKSVKLWPMLDFASAIDDHDFGITHIIRGKDLAVSEDRQKILYAYFGWAYPVTRIYGKFVTTGDILISKSKINEGIKKGRFTGYDDPQLATLRAFRRRGIRPEAIREYMLGLGLSESETTFDAKILEAINRKIIDPGANRYFFAENPVKFKVSGKFPPECRIRKHPQNRERGMRTMKMTEDVYLSRSDAKMKGEFNLMGAMLPAKISGKKITILEKSESRQFIHWLPADSKQALAAKIYMPDGSVKKGVVEANIMDEKEGAVVQLERFGFARIDSTKANKAVRLYYTHK